MANDALDTSRDRAEVVRRALIEAALIAHEDAGLSGLCAEGRWEAAVDAMRSLELAEAAQVGANRPFSGGGSAAALAGSLAAALTQMIAGLTAGRPKYAHVAVEMQHAAQRAATLAAELSALVGRDAAACDAVMAAYKLPNGTEEAASARAAAIERAMLPATRVPVEIARAAAAVAELAANVAERGNTNAVADAAAASLLAESVCRASALTVRVNVAALRDTHAGLQLKGEALALAEVAASAAARAVAAVERTC